MLKVCLLRPLGDSQQTGSGKSLSYAEALKGKRKQIQNEPLNSITGRTVNNSGRLDINHQSLSISKDGENPSAPKKRSNQY